MIGRSESERICKRIVFMLHGLSLHPIGSYRLKIENVPASDLDVPISSFSDKWLNRVYDTRNWTATGKFPAFVPLYSDGFLAELEGISCRALVGYDIKSDSYTIVVDFEAALLTGQ